MKTQFFFLAVLLLLLASCTEASFEDTSKASPSWKGYSEAITKAASECLSHGVSDSDAIDYLHYRKAIDSADIKDVSRYSIDDSNYVFIVHLNDDHWFLLSGDYSSTPILAEGGEGFNLQDKPSKHAEAWLQSIASYMTENRSGRTQDVEINKAEWIHSKTVAEKARDKEKRINRDDPDTSDVIIEVDSEWLIDEYYPALTETRWDQGYPFNLSLPLYPPYGTIDRCVAGCAVTAIAQLLYYTHFAFGYPNDVYAEASCSQHYDASGTPPYSYTFSSPSTTSWNLMGLTSQANYNSTYVPALYAMIASSSNTNYHDGEGSTSPSTICPTLANFMLTGASPEDYNKSDVIDEIEDDRPVLCSGGDSYYTTIGHIFLIDGYEWQKIRETETIKDLDGNILEINVTIHDYFRWHINTGDPYVGYHIWSYENAYYQYNRKIYIGWS